jgi:hypothetical protein
MHALRDFNVAFSQAENIYQDAYMTEASVKYRVVNRVLKTVSVAERI